MKPCTGCRIEKEDSCFHKNILRIDGLSIYCKECLSKKRSNPDAVEKKRQYSKDHYQKNKERIDSKNRSWQKVNKDRWNKYGRDKRALDPEKANRTSRNAEYTRKFGLSIDEIDNFLQEQQGGKCAICRNEIKLMDSHKTHVDHCHKSNQFRGILCHNCNKGLGNFRDNVDSLKSAIEYLIGGGLFLQTIAS